MIDVLKPGVKWPSWVRCEPCVISRTVAGLETCQNDTLPNETATGLEEHVDLVGVTSTSDSTPPDSFGRNTSEVQQFLAELQGLDNRRAFVVWSGRTMADSAEYSTAERRVQAAATGPRKAACRSARMAAEAIAQARLDDSTLAMQVVSIVGDLAGVIAVRDSIPEEDFDLLLRPWTRRPGEPATEQHPWRPRAVQIAEEATMPEELRIAEEAKVAEEARIAEETPRDEAGLEEPRLDEAPLDAEWAAAVAEAGRIAEDARLARAARDLHRPEEARMTQEAPVADEVRLEDEVLVESEIQPDSARSAGDVAAESLVRAWPAEDAALPDKDPHQLSGPFRSAPRPSNHA
jgi:hypothetical protein